MRLKKKSPDAVTEGVVASRDNGKSASSFVSFTYRTGYFVSFHKKFIFGKKIKRNFTTKTLICSPHQTLQYNVESFCIALSFFYENFVLVVTADDADEETAHRHDK